MEAYKKHLKNETILLAAASIVLLAAQILAYCRVLTPIAGDSHWLDMWNGFVAGASFGIMALFIVGIIVNLRAIRSEKHLKKLYIRETDERSTQIALRGKSAGNSIFLIVGLVATIVSGYFSITISLTVLCCVFINSVSTALCKLYFAMKL